MKIFAVRNHNEVGIDRVNRDGEVSVVKDEDVEVSVDERMEWYGNAKLGEERKLDTESNDGGHPMRRDEKMRTSLPRPEEFSTERRLEEERNPGSTTDFKSEATKEQAIGKAFCMVSPVVMAGNTLSPRKTASISLATGVSVEDIVMLEEIAVKNPDLTSIYASVDIPGLVVDDGNQLVKESEPENECSKCKTGKPSPKDGEEMNEKELAGFGAECGLCD
jgi:hypothetical protein